jgi:GH18 family chitinase
MEMLMLKRCIALLLLIISIQQVQAQRIMGYFPAYRSPVVANIEFNKMTDVVFAFINFNATTGVLDNTNMAVLTTLITNARNRNPTIRIHIATGGGNFGTAPFQTLTAPANATARATFVTQMCNLISTNNLDGWNLDWEHPATTAEKNQQQTLVSDMRAGLNAKEATMCKKLEVSVAVGGLMNVIPPSTSTINLATTGIVDNVLVMAYDGGPGVPGAPNHSSYTFAQQALDGWNAWGVPYSKLVLGVPFYSWDATLTNAFTFSQLIAMNAAQVFPNDAYNGNYYNGSITMSSKVDLAMRPGKVTAGIMIWEIGQDDIGTTYSLLNVLYQKFKNSYALGVTFPNPCTLPVDLIEFTAKKNGSLIELNWSTSNEVDNSYFTISRSYEGRSAEVIDTVYAAKDMGMVHYYSTNDMDVSSTYNKVQYKLIQHDINGRLKVLKEIMIQCGESYKVIVSNDRESFYLTSMSEEPQEIQFYTMEGIMVAKLDKTSFTQSNGVIEVYANTISQGLFIVRILLEKNIKSEKILLN